MPTVRELTEIRAARFADIEAILAAPAGTDGELDADQDSRLRELRDGIGRLETRIAAQELLDNRDRAARGTPIAGTAGAGHPELRVFAHAASPAPDAFDGAVMVGQDGSRVPVLEARHRLADFTPAAEQRGPGMSFGGFLRALYFGPSNEAERRAMAESSIGSGGALVPAPMAAAIIDELRARSVAFRAGARVIPMTSQTLKVAKLVKTPVGAWRAENAPIAEDQPAFDQATLTAKSWALLTKISRELLEDGTNTDAILRQAFANSAALALDQAILYGTGSGNQPLGVANTPGIQAVSMGGANGGPFTNWAKVLDAVLALESANAGDVTAMVAAPRTARALYGLVDGQSQPLTPPPRVAAIPVLVTTSASITETQGTSNASSSIILGDFGEVFVGLRTALQISVLNERYADTGQVGFVSWLRADVLLARPAAMARISGITG